MSCFAPCAGRELETTTRSPGHSPCGRCESPSGSTACRDLYVDELVKRLAVGRGDQVVAQPEPFDAASTAAAKSDADEVDKREDDLFLGVQPPPAGARARSWRSADGGGDGAALASTLAAGRRRRRHRRQLGRRRRRSRSARRARRERRRARAGRATASSAARRWRRRRAAAAAADARAACRGVMRLRPVSVLKIDTEGSVMAGCTSSRATSTATTATTTTTTAVSAGRRRLHGPPTVRRDQVQVSSRACVPGRSRTRLPGHLRRCARVHRVRDLRACSELVRSRAGSTTTTPTT